MVLVVPAGGHGAQGGWVFGVFPWCGAKEACDAWWRAHGFHGVDVDYNVNPEVLFLQFRDSALPGELVRFGVS